MAERPRAHRILDAGDGVRLAYHRLSSPANLALLATTVSELLDHL